MVGTQLGLGAAVGVLAFAFFYANLRFAQRGMVPEPVVVRLAERAPDVDLTRVLRRLALPVALVLGLLTGLSASGGWLTLLRWVHRTSFGISDPVFGRDVGYYVFVIPALASVVSLVVGLTVVALFLSVGLYVLRRDLLIQRRRVRVERAAEVHLASLVALLFLAAAVSAWWIQLPELLYTRSGPLFGANHADLTIRAPTFRLLGIAAVVGAAFTLWGLRSASCCTPRWPSAGGSPRPRCSASWSIRTSW